MNNKTMEVSSFIDLLKTHACEHLFDDECYARIENVRQQFGHLQSNYVIWEAPLSIEEKSVDCSILFPYHTSYGKNYGLEMDYETCSSESIVPCCGFNLSKTADVRELFYAARKILPMMIPKEVIIALWPQIEKISSMAFDWHGGVSDIAYMKGRSAGKKLKIFLQYLAPEAALDILKRLEWSGNLFVLQCVLNECIHYCKSEKVIIDFSISPQGISSKVGIGVSLKDQQSKTVASFLDFLTSKGLCLPEKARDVLKFIEAGTPSVENRITQFKLPFMGGGVSMAKVYLGQKLL